MRWPFRRRAGEVDPAERPSQQWRDLPALATVLGPAPGMVDRGFVRTLPSRWQQPPALRRMGHHVSLEVSGGLVSGLARTVGTGHRRGPDLIWPAPPGLPAGDGASDPPYGEVARQVVRREVQPVPASAHPAHPAHPVGSAQPLRAVPPPASPSPAMPAGSPPERPAAPAEPAESVRPAEFPEPAAPAEPPEPPEPAEPAGWVATGGGSRTAVTEPPASPAAPPPEPMVRRGPRRARRTRLGPPLTGSPDAAPTPPAPPESAGSPMSAGSPEPGEPAGTAMPRSPGGAPAGSAGPAASAAVPGRVPVERVERVDPGGWPGPDDPAGSDLAGSGPARLAVPGANPPPEPADRVPAAPTAHGDSGGWPPADTPPPAAPPAHGSDRVGGRVRSRGSAVPEIGRADPAGTRTAPLVSGRALVRPYRALPGRYGQTGVTGSADLAGMAGMAGEARYPALPRGSDRGPVPAPSGPRSPAPGAMTEPPAGGPVRAAAPDVLAGWPHRAVPADPGTAPDPGAGRPGGAPGEESLPELPPVPTLPTLSTRPALPIRSEPGEDGADPMAIDPMVLDRLSRQIYGRLRGELAADLLVGRERAQLLTDLI